MTNSQLPIHLLVAHVDDERYRRLRSKLGADGMTYRRWLTERIDRYVAEVRVPQRRTASRPNAKEA